MFDGRFFATYHYASVVHNVLSDRFAYLRSLEGFHCDGAYLELAKPFPKYSAFHSFIEFIVDGLIAAEPESVDLDERKQLRRAFRGIPEALRDIQPTRLPIEDELQQYGIQHDSFVKWLRQEGKTFGKCDEDDVGEYYQSIRLGCEYERLITRCVAEVFHILFQNRYILLQFNCMMAEHVGDTSHAGLEPEFEALFEADGVLKRVNVPTWVRRAVFYRDRGLCTLCEADLTGTINIGDAEHFDHVVPLAQGGLNDVSNIQLLCSRCNGKKGHSAPITSNRYEAWYPSDE